MQLRYITCSGANENTNIKELIDLANTSNLVEIGIIANSSTMKKGKPQYEWFEQLLNTQESANMKLALHINGDWCTDLCAGKIAPELKELLDLKNQTTGTPVINRWQLNISNSMNLTKTDGIKSVIKDNPEKEFIFSFNKGPIVMMFVKQLYDAGLPSHCFMIPLTVLGVIQNFGKLLTSQAVITVIPVGCLQKIYLKI